MEIRNCKECGRLFNYLSGRPICQDCKQKLEDKFMEVKNYIREHGRASIAEVAEANDVDTKQIKQWVREERLVFSDDSPVTIDCESCGAPIKSGRFCKECASKMTDSFESAIRKSQPVVEQRRDTRDKDRMRFLDKH
ncbi:flagellar operon protein TIGR03826 [Lachnospiraceae bacterium XBB1006]|nr:flagellar operon protein TIGR03826 [Lachnospiraceae bacterium XBB1006]